MIEIKDLKGLQRGLDRLADKMDAGARKAIGETAAEVFVTSQSLVPVDTGDLRSSGAVSGVVKIDDVYQVAIGYGKDYAAFVHEDLSANHPHGGQAKYLEQPLNSSGETLANKLARAIK